MVCAMYANGHFNHITLFRRVKFSVGSIVVAHEVKKNKTVWKYTKIIFIH